MSEELKTYDFPVDHGDFTATVEQFYLKSEADKVIAELKSQKAQAEDDCAYWKTMARKNAADNAEMAKQRAEALKRECYHKYKRCLMMAKWCHDKRIMSLCWDPADGYTADYFLHYRKWEKRWLALAEKFKEAK